jgi:hypothetical protein
MPEANDDLQEFADATRLSLLHQSRASTRAEGSTGECDEPARHGPADLECGHLPPDLSRASQAHSSGQRWSPHAGHRVHTHS